MELWKYSGKNVIIHFKDGDVLKGKARDFIPKQDNPSGVASISIGIIEIYEDEIEKIEELKWWPPYFNMAAFLYLKTIKQEVWTWKYLYHSPWWASRMSLLPPKGNWLLNGSSQCTVMTLKSLTTFLMIIIHQMLLA